MNPYWRLHVGVFNIFQSLYRNQVKDLKEEIESKQKHIQDIIGDMKGVDHEK